MLNLAGYVLRRGTAWLRRRLVLPRRPRPEPEVLPYKHWITQRLRERRVLYPAVKRPGLFSLLTPVFDPPAGFFRILGESVLAQDHRDWQWVIVDNGCTQPDVLYLLQRFARDPRVTLVNAGTPRGIIGGMRLALEHATGEYVCPVDHDDRLYPDALRVVAAGLEARDWPKLAYTDEDKLLPDGQSGMPFHKPGWDPLLFLNCCYVAHLSVMHRQTALALDIYSDPQSEGTPDGDSFCRFVTAGHEPVHIPEVTYSWRMHPQSTALLGIQAKPYVTASQKHALSRYLDRMNLSERIGLRTNALHGVPGTWRICAASPSGDCVPVLLGPGESRKQRRTVLQRLVQSEGIGRVHRLRAGRGSDLEVLATLPGDSWVIVLDPHCLPLATDFVRELQVVRDAVPNAVWVGGHLLDPDGLVHSAGLVWGFGDVLGAPLRASPCHDHRPGCGALIFQRSVSAVDTGFSLVQVGLLRDALELAQSDLADPLLPAWLGALAWSRGQRVLITPYALGQMQAAPPPRCVSFEAKHRFLACFGFLLQADAYYSRFFGVTPKRAYEVVHPVQRARVMEQLLCSLADSCPHYREWVGSPNEYPSPAPFIAGECPARPCQQPSAAA